MAELSVLNQRISYIKACTPVSKDLFTDVK